MAFNADQLIRFGFYKDTNEDTKGRETGVNGDWENVYPPSKGRVGLCRFTRRAAVHVERALDRAVLMFIGFGAALRQTVADFPSTLERPEPPPRQHRWQIKPRARHTKCWCCSSAWWHRSNLNGKGSRSVWGLSNWAWKMYNPITGEYLGQKSYYQRFTWNLDSVHVQLHGKKQEWQLWKAGMCNEMHAIPLIDYIFSTTSYADGINPHFLHGVSSVIYLFVV